MKNKTHLVKIDGRDETLTLVSTPGPNQSDYQYNTKGNKAAHRFPRRIQAGEKFRVNGSRYEIIT